MSKVAENLRRAQEAGELSREDAEGIAEFYKLALDRHNGDEEAAKKEIAAWLATKIRAARHPKQLKRPAVPTGESPYTMFYGFIAGLAGSFLLVVETGIDRRILFTAPLWPAVIAVFYTLLTASNMPPWAMLASNSTDSESVDGDDLR